MVDYSIAAFPTEYKGRMYRSRLEARWAAFFDRLGIAAEYEPFDLGAWSPDFLLTDLNTLVEIKPLTEFDGEAWAKAIVACKDRGLLTGDNQISGLFMSLVAPYNLKSAVVQIGWLAMPWLDDGMSPHPAFLGWQCDADYPTFFPDIIVVISRGRWVSAAGHDGSSDDEPCPYVEHTMRQWALATSDVQWQSDAE